jgi:hypothetical protein
MSESQDALDEKWRVLHANKVPITRKVTEVKYCPDGSPCALKCAYLPQDYAKPAGRKPTDVILPLYERDEMRFLTVYDLCRACGKDEYDSRKEARAGKEGTVMDTHIFYGPDGKLRQFVTFAYAITQIQHALEIKSAKRKELKNKFLHLFGVLDGRKSLAIPPVPASQAKHAGDGENQKKRKVSTAASTTKSKPVDRKSEADANELNPEVQRQMERHTRNKTQRPPATATEKDTRLEEFLSEPAKNKRKAAD